MSLFFRRIKLPRAALAALLFLSASASWAKDKEVIIEQGKEVVVERNVEMKTRDGVTLKADVYRPNRAGQFPVILERNPYDKRLETFGPRAASEGYVFIVQDVRGRYASEGEWYPLRHEPNDGYDTVEWAATLPYANGQVGMFGWSYSAATQFAAAMATPPHLVCILPGFIATNSHEQWVYTGGAFSQAFNQGWSTALAQDVLARRVSKVAVPSHWGDMKEPPSTYKTLDVGTWEGLATYYYDWLRHPDYDDYWKELAVEEHYKNIKVPALHFGGWYDYFVQGTLSGYAGLKARAGHAAARGAQRLVMEVGGHSGADRKVGIVDYGADSVVDYWALALRWYDYQLKGIKNGLEKEKPVRIFVMGANEWMDLDDWPAPGTVERRYYLQSGGRANSRAGDGRLESAPPAAEQPADRFVADPENPVPTIGGPAFGDSSLVHMGPQDQGQVEDRSDVLVYSTAPLSKPCRVMGAVQVDLYVSSSAVDTDFTGKLVDVGPDGTPINIAEGILRARYRESREKAKLLTPDEVTRLTVDLGATAYVFKPGHRIRLEVAGSNFPRFDRNLNTGGAQDSPSNDGVKATNQVHHAAVTPSSLVLTVLP
ncbi:MAG: CocE/NonD family hydrolase [Opitutaceae bacterium]|nr:CocE/NonD family hydrolase [Cephaloticoccus sp.]MCP5529283.1 CocE/NonD family hydrolase [Opitutaceae bacterium]